LASQAATLVVTTQQLTYSALSPDGQTVAYVSGYSLKAIGIDGSNDRTLLAGPNQDGGGYGHPAFLADPQTVIYGTNGSIGSIRIDGSDNQTLLTTIPDSFEYPNPGFSPDYTQLAVGSGCGRDAPEALRIFMTASLPGEPCGAGQFLVDVNEGASPNSANDPSWGSNGKIAYSSYPDVWVIDASGGTPTNMTSGLTGDAGTLTASDPRWAPGCWVLP
jgi:Tol biopolymer transport system component